jgi:hypothetical protein
MELTRKPHGDLTSAVDDGSQVEIETLAHQNPADGHGTPTPVERAACRLATEERGLRVRFHGRQNSMSNVDEPIRPTNREQVLAEPTVPGRRVALYCLTIVSVATAVIHFAVSGEHFEEYWVFGVFMLVVAWLQLLWAFVAVAKPSRLLLWGGAVLNAGVICVYAVTRTVGDVIGPTPHDIEPFGFGDGFCTVLEAVTVVGCVWLLFAKADRPVRRQRLVMASAATGAAIAILLSVALVDGGSEMVMSVSDSSATGTTPAMSMSGTQMAGGQTSSIKLATTSPAGDITMPDPNMQMAAGMKMASSTSCDAMPTKSQQTAAVNLVDTSWKESSKYQSLAAAKAAGYRPVTPSGQSVVHYINPAYYRATALGGPVLNTADPQSLVYANTPQGAVLVAAMYITTPKDGTPQPGGCLTQWHVHTNLCVSRGKGVVGETDPTCPAGSVNRVTPAMLHVWFVPIPGGPTAVDASDAQVVHAAEQVAAPANGTA